MRRLLPSTFAFAILLAGCGKPAAKEDAAPDEAAAVSVQIADVERRDVQEALPVDGSLVLPEGASSKLSASAAGRLVEVRVKEGDRVSAGELLARIDTRALVAGRQSAAAGAAAASASAVQADLALRAAQADQASSVKAARLALDVAVAEGDAGINQARADLQKLLAPPRPPEIAQAQQTIDQARIARDKARLDADRDQRLLREGLVAGSQADASQAALQTAESALRSAQAAFDLLKIGPRPEELKATRERLVLAQDLARRRADQARAALRQAETGTLGVAAKAQEATAARLAAAQKAADARVAGAGVSTGEIRSPFSGYVVRRFLNPGDAADPASPVLVVSARRPGADFVGTLSPEEAGRVAKGMLVLVGDLVGDVASVGEPDPGTGLVPVRAHLAGTAKATGFATGRIVLSTLANVAVVPKGAILSREGKDVVFVAKDGVAHQTQVELGPEEGGFVAVRKGVAAGQKVVVLGGHELSDGAKIEAAKGP